MSEHNPSRSDQLMKEAIEILKASKEEVATDTQRSRREHEILCQKALPEWNALVEWMEQICAAYKPKDELKIDRTAKGFMIAFHMGEGRVRQLFVEFDKQSSAFKYHVSSNSVFANAVLESIRNPFREMVENTFHPELFEDSVIYERAGERLEIPQIGKYLIEKLANQGSGQPNRGQSPTNTDVDSSSPTGL